MSQVLEEDSHLLTLSSKVSSSILSQRTATAWELSTGPSDQVWFSNRGHWQDLDLDIFLHLPEKESWVWEILG